MARGAPPRLCPRRRGDVLGYADRSRRSLGWRFGGAVTPGGGSAMAPRGVSAGNDRADDDAVAEGAGLGRRPPGLAASRRRRDATRPGHAHHAGADAPGSRGERAGRQGRGRARPRPPCRVDLTREACVVRRVARGPRQIRNEGDQAAPPRPPARLRPAAQPPGAKIDERAAGSGVPTSRTAIPGSHGGTPGGAGRLRVSRRPRRDRGRRLPVALRQSCVGARRGAAQPADGVGLDGAHVTHDELEERPDQVVLLLRKVLDDRLLCV